jgi:hypothetical protein
MMSRLKLVGLTADNPPQEDSEKKKLQPLIRQKFQQATSIESIADTSN